MFHSDRSSCSSGRESPRINQSALNGTITAELELADALPEGTSIGAKIGGLIGVGAAKNVRFFGRTAAAPPQSTARDLVLQSHVRHTRAAVLQYATQTGYPFRILSGPSDDRIGL